MRPPKEEECDRLERARAVCHLTAALEELPQRLRVALQLRYVEHLTLAEVGQVLDVCPPRARELIREGLSLLMARTKMNQDAAGTA
jgi:DNA-directed RNA polymerase specialized sigma24 family protein